MVNNTYNIQRRFAVSVILGCILLDEGPGDSAIKSSIPPTPNIGSIATVSTIIPIPPIHWVILRQSIIPAGNASISFITEAPVVVYPENVSKIAPEILGIVSLSIKGNAPVIPKIIHPKVTII